MGQQTPEPLASLVLRFYGYLPTLAAGAFVLLLGLLLGWLAKRVVVRMLIWLRLDRLAGRVGWRSAFGKGDVRAALYDLFGNLTLVALVLVFLDNALTIWGLEVLSRLLDRTVFYVPRLMLAGLIAVIGVAIGNSLAQSAEEALEEEEFAHARLMAKGLKAVFLAVVAALALWELDFAREIVLSGFVIAFGAMGVAFALAVGIGSARAIQRGWEGAFKEREKTEPGKRA
jgi:Mechanosensitive ion channel, conserved TM helix